MGGVSDEKDKVYQMKRWEEEGEELRPFIPYFYTNDRTLMIRPLAVVLYPWGRYAHLLLGCTVIASHDGVTCDMVISFRGKRLERDACQSKNAH